MPDQFINGPGTPHIFAACLKSLIGLKLSTIGFAVDMRTVGFGDRLVQSREFPERLVTPFALHLQCPWRIQNLNTIITGSDDWYEREPEGEISDEELNAEERLQHCALRALLADHDKSEKVLTNRTADLIVFDYRIDDWDGFELSLTPQYRLLVFPSGTRREQWRHIDVRANRHVYLAGGTILVAD